MFEPLFNLPHRLPCFDCRRTGHAANRLPLRLLSVAQVRVGRGKDLAFHAPIVAYSAHADATCESILKAAPSSKLADEDLDDELEQALLARIRSARRRACIATPP